MNVFRLLTLLFRFLAPTIIEDGGAAEPEQVDSAPEAVQEAAPVETPAGDAKPASMLDAISQALDKPETGGQPRDDLGRFAPKAGDAEPGAQPVAKAAEPAKTVAPTVPAKTDAEDPLKMPEGLKPESQQRFQTLVNTNKELATKIEQLEPQVSYVRETFQKHGVRQEQFEQAVQFIGAINSGNLQAALEVLDRQRTEIALALGRPLPGVDVLTEHPDLRQAVDSMQITEQHAMELARARRESALAQQHSQALRTQQDQQAQQQAMVDQGLKDIDQFTRQMQASDLDFAVIEAQLLPEIQNLIQGVPPQRWKSIIETQYRLLKKAAAGVRSSLPPSGGMVLRPTGAASPASKPRSMHEAMWGQQAPVSA